VGLAQVEFVAGGAVVHSNRRHGLGAVTVKIADKHDPCGLSHDSSVQRTAPMGHSTPIQGNDRSISPRSDRPQRVDASLPDVIVIDLAGALRWGHSSGGCNWMLSAATGLRLTRVHKKTDSVRVVSQAKGYRSPVPCALSARLTRVLCGHQRTICVRSI
jgi:hypothetical protein